MAFVCVTRPSCRRFAPARKCCKRATHAVPFKPNCIFHSYLPEPVFDFKCFYIVTPYVALAGSYQNNTFTQTCTFNYHERDA